MAASIGRARSSCRWRSRSRALVRWMLGRTFYPDNTYTRDAEAIRFARTTCPPTRSASSWACGAIRSARRSRADLAKLTAHVPLAGTVAASGAERLRARRTAERQLPCGESCCSTRAWRCGASASASADGSVRAGDFLVAARRCGAARSREADGRRFRRRQGGVPHGAYAIRKPRVAMYQRYYGGNMDEGWTRLMFEQFNVPYKSIMDAELKAGGLEAKYDVIILPADSTFGDDRRAPACWRGRQGGGGGGFGGGASRQHAARIPQRLRRRGREGAAGVRREGRHAGDVRDRPAICRFSASACRCATSSRGCRRRSSGRRDRRCA